MANDKNTTKSTDSVGTSEQMLRAARMEKAARIRQRGEDPFTNDIDPASIMPLGKIREHLSAARKDDGTYDPEQLAGIVAAHPEFSAVVVAGRVVAMRSFGKVRFLRLRDWSSDLQLFCRKNVLGEAFARLQDMDVADHVTATGKVMVTKTGELSIEATDFRILTKAYRPLPEKWHGLTDVEVRYRRRYVDLISNQEARSIFKARSIIVQSLRRYLDDRGFLEVETPTMNALVGGATAKPFVTHHNALDMELYMRIAPELYLKRLVVGGFERVYEIGRCYRNEGLSTRHNPEFTMLEFYMGYANYQTLMDMNEEIFRSVDEALRERMPEQHAVWAERRPFRLDLPFERRTMHSLILRALEQDAPLQEDERKLRKALVTVGLDASVVSDKDALAAVFEQALQRAAELELTSSLRKQLGGCDNHGERIFFLYEMLAEPSLPQMFQHEGKSIPVFVTDHPVEVSPLARRQTREGGDPELVDRFELFVHGRELCNAFSELNDPEDQAARFRHQVEKKAAGAEETMDYDEDYIRALEHGLPPTAGFGLGIDRLTMALTSQESIREVILFPLLRPEH